MALLPYPLQAAKKTLIIPAMKQALVKSPAFQLQSMMPAVMVFGPQLEQHVALTPKFHGQPLAGTKKKQHAFAGFSSLFVAQYQASIVEHLDALSQAVRGLRQHVEQSVLRRDANPVFCTKTRGQKSKPTRIQKKASSTILSIKMRGHLGRLKALAFFLPATRPWS